MGTFRPTYFVQFTLSLFFTYDIFPITIQPKFRIRGRISEVCLDCQPNFDQAYISIGHWCQTKIMLIKAIALVFIWAPVTGAQSKQFKVAYMSLNPLVFKSGGALTRESVKCRHFEKLPESPHRKGRLSRISVFGVRLAAH
eukprot:1156395-Pelagomonas_calceolata.AAC.12